MVGFRYKIYEGSLHVKKEYEKEVGSVPTILDKKEFFVLDLQQLLQ